ncbi:MAG TPA: TetR/AcrR family transcriptional regulator C-terminal domain-containing protein [Amycolatopsis sp.]|nr:TetR/AcrR family transcriptional regulator C-terminal domain-containing protein [Amycolatopsis sp.]
MPRPRSLTLDQIAAAALAVLDRDGLDGLSMRAVGKQLGFGTMSLYRYITDREQLEGLIVDLVLRDVDLDLPPVSAHDRLVLLAQRVRHVVREHPAVVPLLLTQRHNSPGSRRWGEAALSVFAEAGFRGERRVVAFRAFLSYVLGALQTSHFSPLAGTGTDVLAALSEEEFPLLGETARHARGVTAEREFREGLEFLLRGFGLRDAD